MPARCGRAQVCGEQHAQPRGAITTRRQRPRGSSDEQSLVERVPLRHRRRIATPGRSSGRARRRQVAGIEDGIEIGVEGPPFGAMIRRRGVGDAIAATAVVPVALRPRGDAGAFIGLHPLAVFAVVVVAVTVTVFLGLGSVLALGGVR